MVRRRIGWKLLLAATMVMAAALAAARQSQDMWLEAGIEPAQVYVQAQAIYRLRFYQAVDVRELQINGPSARLADVRAIGTGRVYEALRDGRRYRVHERSYAVFPFSSGPLELSGAHVLGRVTAGAATSVDGRQPLRLEALAQTMTVRPAPTAAAGATWLPAHSLTLTEVWSAPATEVRLGQALRRSIRIEAAGIDAGQIPPLQVVAPGMLVEADPPRLENRLAGELNIGVREQSFRMVALRAGEVLVPALQLRWWNLATDTLASATLPAHSLRVAAADAAPASLLPNTASRSPSLPQQRRIPTTLQPMTPLPTPTRSQLLLAAVALLGAGLALAYARRPGVRAAWRLQRACRCGNAGAVHNALLHWAATIWPQARPLTLEALAQRWPDPAARAALVTLDRCLYGPHPSRCDDAALAAAVRAIQRSSWGFSATSRANK